MVALFWETPKQNRHAAGQDKTPSYLSRASLSPTPYRRTLALIPLPWYVAAYVPSPEARAVAGSRIK